MTGKTHGTPARALLAGSLLLALAGCGGEGNGVEASGDGNMPEMPVAGDWPIDRDTARSLIQGQDAQLSADEIVAALHARISKADAMTASDFLVSGVATPRFTTTCGGSASCTVDLSSLSTAVPGLGEEEWSVEDLDYEGSETEYQAVAMRGGVVLAQGRGETNLFGLLPIDRYGYGGWLEHSLFVAERAEVTDHPLLPDISAAYSYSAGDAAGSNPVSGNATWNGVMVGLDVSETQARGNPVQGHAVIELDLASQDIDVAFTNIADVVTGNAHGAMAWADLALTDGAFETGSTGDSISGRFYGADHEEVGGIFERNLIVGAFGAARE